MKILLFIITFIFSVSSLGMTENIVKGSVSLVSNNYDVICLSESNVNAQSFDVGMKILLLEPWGITTIKEKGSAKLLFSNGMNVFMAGKTTLWIDNFELFTNKNDDEKVVIDDESFIGNFRLNGSSEFKLKSISDAGFFNIITNGADLHIKSKHFSVRTDANFTYVNCYDGTIEFTNSSNTKETTTLNKGYTAEVWGKNGETNLFIKISKTVKSEID